MHLEQRDRTDELLRRRGLSRALFAHPAHVTWLTGVALPWQAGADLYAGGPALVWYEDGAFTLILMDGHAGPAAPFGQLPNCTLVTYTGYTYEQQPNGPELLAAALHEVVAGPGRTAVGIETRHLPVALQSAVQDALPDETRIMAIDGWLDPLRVRRTEEELDKMRANFALIDAAHAVCDAVVKPGNAELDVWHAIHQALQSAAGETLYLGNDCTVGRRMGGPALDVEILATDSFIVDLSTIWRGYWSDSCVTYYAGEPSTQQRAMHRAVAAALEVAVALARPGARCGDIDRATRDVLTAQGYPTYPHHTGHGIGVVGHEAPRVTPHSDEVLEAGMVVMLEPGLYVPGQTGVRLEQAVLVGPDGPQILSGYGLNIP